MIKLSVNKETTDFFEIKLRANGLLDPAIYRTIFLLSKNVDKNIIEIGTAHGAATIAAALGAPENTIVYSIDKIAGGSRDDYGSLEENIKIISDNFKYFQVENKISFHIGNSEELIDKIPHGEPIGMLILDADGAIDRDFRLYFNILEGNAPIVIDDYRPEYIHAISTSKNTIFVDQKYRLTSYFIDYFEQSGLIVREKVIKHTYFGRKVENANFDVDSHIEEILKIYRKLTFCFPQKKSKLAYLLSQKLWKFFPKTHFRLKEFFGRSAIDN